jgi:hypothetical protein
MKKTIPLIVYHANQDDPKKCTAKKLHRFGFAVLQKNTQRLPSHAILLNPFAEKSLRIERLLTGKVWSRWIVLGKPLSRRFSLLSVG